MPQTILGVDVGSYSVKIVQIERGFGEFKIVGFYEVPLVAEQVLTFEQAASAALAKFLEENPIPYDSCVLSLPGSLTAFRFLELPFGNAKKIDQTIDFELESLIPFDLENILYDYSILSLSPQNSKVLAAYLPEEDFKKFLNQMQVSGVDPKYIGVDTVDLSNLAHLGVLPPAGRYAILDLGHTKSNFTVLEGNNIKMLRCLSWGGHRLNQAMAQVSGLTYDQAEGMKHTKAQLVAGSDDKIFEAIHRNFLDLMQQIKQTLFAFYESGEPAIEALYVCGGTSRIPGVESFFSQQLNINVSSLDVLDDVYTQIRDREGARPVIPAALAAAVRAIYPNKGMRINFRRGDYAYKRDIREMEGSLKKIGMMAAAVVGLGLLYFIISYISLSSQVGKMNKNIAKLVRASVADLPKTGVDSANSALSVLNARITGMQDKLKKVEGEGSLNALQVLKMISAAMPPREQLVVDIDDVNITPDRVRFEGRTLSYEGVDKIKASLSQVKNFKNVETGDVRKGVKDEIKFKVSFDLTS
jgi:general secretion pathway protein L